MGDQRLEGLHHELGYRHHLARHDHSDHVGTWRRARRSRRSSFRRGRPASSWASAIQRSAGPPRIRGSSRLATVVCLRTICSDGAGKGYAQFLETLDEGRIAIAALSVGLAQGCIDECVRYVNEREAFGRTIGHFQVIQFKLADMQARAHIARLAYHDAARRMAKGERFKEFAAIAKLVASDSRDGERARGDPDLRRLRVHERDARRTLLPRREDPRDRRRDLRSPANDHRSCSRPQSLSVTGSSGVVSSRSWAMSTTRTSCSLPRARIASSIMILQYGHAVETTSAPVARASSVRSRLIRVADRLLHPHARAACPAAKTALSTAMHLDRCDRGRRSRDDRSGLVEDPVVPTEVARVVVGDGRSTACGARRPDETSSSRSCAWWMTSK